MLMDDALLVHYGAASGGVDSSYNALLALPALNWLFPCRIYRFDRIADCVRVEDEEMLHDNKPVHEFGNNMGLVGEDSG